MGHHQSIRQARVSSLHQYCIRKNTSVQITLPNARGRVRSSMHLVPSSQEYTIRVFFFKLVGSINKYGIGCRRTKKGNDVRSVDEEICETEYRRNCVRVHMLAALAHYNRVMICSLI